MRMFVPVADKSFLVFDTLIQNPVEEIGLVHLKIKEGSTNKVKLIYIPWTDYFFFSLFWPLII